MHEAPSWFSPHAPAVLVSAAATVAADAMWGSSDFDLRISDFRR